MFLLLQDSFLTAEFVRVPLKLMYLSYVQDKGY